MLSCARSQQFSLFILYPFYLQKSELPRCSWNGRLRSCYYSSLLGLSLCFGRDDKGSVYPKSKQPVAFYRCPLRF